MSFLISCGSAYISPDRFSYTTLFAVAFPYLLILLIVCGVISLFIKRSLAVILFLGLLPAYRNLTHTVAFHFPQKWQPAKNDSVLRIFTWNVQYFGYVPNSVPASTEMMALIEDHKPDIVCMQEFSNAENGGRRAPARREMDSLGYKYHFFSNDNVVQHKKVIVTYGVAIFSKYPFIDSGRINISSGQMKENLAYASLVLNGKPIRIYTAHLASFDLYRDTSALEKDVYQITYDRKRVIQYKLRETEQLHQREISVINNSISKSPFPMIYCGDLNTTPCSYNYRLLKNNFQDAFLKKGSGIGTTFYKLLPTLRIDVCFTDTSFKIDQCTVVKSRLSDHYPLVTDIRWK